MPKSQNHPRSALLCPAFYSSNKVEINDYLCTQATGSVLKSAQADDSYTTESDLLNFHLQLIFSVCENYNWFIIRRSHLMAQKPPLLRCNRPSLQSVSSCKMYLSILQMCLSNLQNVFVYFAKYICPTCKMYLSNVRDQACNQF